MRWETQMQTPRLNHKVFSESGLELVLQAKNKISMPAKLSSLLGFVDSSKKTEKKNKLENDSKPELIEEDKKQPEKDKESENDDRSDVEIFVF